jgi:hypothetical protein
VAAACALTGYRASNSSVSSPPPVSPEGQTHSGVLRWHLLLSPDIPLAPFPVGALPAAAFPTFFAAGVEG